MNPALALLLFVFALSATAQTNSSVATNNAMPEAGIAASTQATNFSPIQLSERLREECINGRRMICGRILRIFPEGLVVESGYTNLLREALTKSWLVPGSATATRADNLVESAEPNAVCVGTVFLTDLPRGGKPHQYDYVILTGYPAGQHTYTSVGELKKTVRHFSANLDKAVKHNFEAIVNAGQTSSSDMK